MNKNNVRFNMDDGSYFSVYIFGTLKKTKPLYFVYFKVVSINSLVNHILEAIFFVDAVPHPVCRLPLVVGKPFWI